MAQLMLQVIDSFGITNSVFTITRNHASPNNIMLAGPEAEG
jgi:hypothetical protein